MMYRSMVLLVVVLAGSIRGQSLGANEWQEGLWVIGRSGELLEGTVRMNAMSSIVLAYYYYSHAMTW